MPSVAEICTLSLVFGRSFESLFGPVFADVRTELEARLATLPRKKGQGWLGGFKRQQTLDRIASSLTDNHRHNG